ncbi:MAG: hypothetical protein QM820_62580 [Minicystis sp.]
MRTRWIPAGTCLFAALALSFTASAGPEEAKTILEQGRERQKLAMYDEAADRYERFARMSPQASEAPEALQDAIVLRLGLGQADEAIRDAEGYLKLYGAKLPEQAARVSLAIALHFSEREEHEAAKKQLVGWLSAFGQKAPLQARVLAHARLGRAHAKLGHEKEAAAEYEVVRELWKDPAAAVKAIEAESSDARRLGGALNALGEAMFFFAEQKRRELDAIRYPAYRGRASKEEIEKHINTKVVDWIRKKRPAIEAVEREYRKIVDIPPMAPPAWVIASGNRVGQMWARFAAELRAAPIPSEWQGHGTIAGTNVSAAEIRAAYYQAVDDAAEPLRQRAKAAFKSCLDHAVKYQYFDANARQCIQWLSKRYTSEVVPLDEILPKRWLIGAPPLPGAPLPDPR